MRYWKIILIKLRGGVFEITKTVLAVAVMVVLIAGVIAPAFQDVHAYTQKAKFSSEKLKAKSYGIKTKDKVSFDEKETKHNSFGEIKKQDVKNYKKIMAEYSAKKILKNLYNLG
ncbi:hypothetical protein NZNM25_10070 [Nitrosopumilus zosterae]|uniref:Uncharacterized protein n=1 Tax=Nitrosopumilus zosterae TaxID=718286 RepID=A0A2S2KRC9_9ARCH|nr:hypothetical protein [Nitrosopumilus zosterae]BDQ30352.1 hypothetical protein NZOSNM25_000454 [Nitrosopumilus zosterae]GBH34216.1 hypothetical protein NZNM25_10070 [Nitrosopumilus zosterae]